MQQNTIHLHNQIRVSLKGHSRKFKKPKARGNVQMQVNSGKADFLLPVPHAMSLPPAEGARYFRQYKTFALRAKSSPVKSQQKLRGPSGSVHMVHRRRAVGQGAAGVMST